MVDVSFYENRRFHHFQRYNSVEEAADDIQDWVEDPQHSVRIKRSMAE